MNKIVQLLISVSVFIISPAFALHGYIEKVMLLPNHVILNAKLDTGAATSSLNVKDVKTFQKQGQTWVKFDIYNKTLLVKNASYPLLKMISIKQRAHEQTEDKRPLIAMEFCLGNKKRLIQVNLMDRQDFDYPFLLGREAMRKFNIVVDPSKKYLNPLKCQ